MTKTKVHELRMRILNVMGQVMDLHDEIKSLSDAYSYDNTDDAMRRLRYAETSLEEAQEKLSHIGN